MDTVNTFPLPELGERRTTADHIADTLRNAILTGVFEDGQELNQVALADHFGVSRVPIREALRLLQAENLVSGQAHRRAVVTTLSIDTVLETLEIRALLESHLLARAVEIGFEPEEIERLEDMCREMEEINDHEKWLALNRDFHQELSRPAGSVVALGLADQLSARVTRYLHLWTHGTGVTRYEEANRQHWAIVKAVASGDVEECRRKLAEHISSTKNVVIELYERRQSE